MATAWLSYAWNDNDSSDVDFAAQELIAAGLQIKLDRWDVQAGKRLWEQIEQLIQNPSLSDAWILYATQNSLGSEPCRRICVGSRPSSQDARQRFPDYWPVFWFSRHGPDSSCHPNTSVR